MSTWSYISRIIVLITACWLIIDMILDGIQAPIYWKLSPYLNKNHEANMNLTKRIVELCKRLEKTQFIQSIFNEKQIHFYAKWSEKCKHSDFSIANDYDLNQKQLKKIKVINNSFNLHPEK